MVRWVCVLDMAKKEENVKKIVLALGTNDEIHSSSASQTTLAANKAQWDVTTAYPDADIYYSSIIPRTGQEQAIVSSNNRIRKVNECL